MQVNEFLENSARSFPDKTALICDGHRWTYSELDRNDPTRASTSPALRLSPAATFSIAWSGAGNSTSPNFQHPNSSACTARAIARS